MNARIFWKALQGRTVSLAVLAVFLLGFEWMFVAIWPSMGGQAGIGSLLEAMSSQMKAFLKTQGSGVSLLALDGFLAMGYYHPLAIVVPAAFAIASGASAVAGEIERRTILLLLARPIPRYHIIIGKAAVTALGLAVLMAAGVAGTAIGLWTIDVGEKPDLVRYLWVGVNGFALYLAVASYSYLLSALLDDSGRTVSLATAITVVFFLFDFIADLWDVVQWLAPFSIFDYYNPAGIVGAGGLAWGDMGVLLGVSVICFVASLVIFQRRDIAG